MRQSRVILARRSRGVLRTLQAPCRGIFLVVLAAIAVGAGAQGYPVKSVRFIVPYGAGGGADVMGRMISGRMSEALKQQVIIDNRGGAGSNIGNELAARAPADGYTLLMGAAALAINVSLYRRLNYDAVKDFTAISLLASSPNIVVVHPSVPVRSIRELIALAKSHPGQLHYASGGSGTTPHLAAELLKTTAGVQIVHVPYKSAGPALIGLVSGEIEVSLLPGITVLSQVSSGRLRALAITSRTRAPALPQLPTVAESGFPGFEASQWYGVLVPAGTAEDIVNRLHGVLAQIMRTSEIADRVVRDASIPIGNTPAEFAVYLREEIAKWAKVVAASGARVE